MCSNCSLLDCVLYINVFQLVGFNTQRDRLWGLENNYILGINIPTQSDWTKLYQWKIQFWVIILTYTSRKNQLQKMYSSLAIAFFSSVLGHNTDLHFLQEPVTKMCFPFVIAFLSCLNLSNFILQYTRT